MNLPVLGDALLHVEKHGAALTLNRDDVRNALTGMRLTQMAQRMELKALLELCASFQGMCHNEPEHLDAVRRFLER